MLKKGHVGGRGPWVGSAHAVVLVTMRSLRHGHGEALSHGSHWVGKGSLLLTHRHQVGNCDLYLLSLASKL